MREEISQELFERAKKKIPGGVNSPVRAFQMWMAMNILIMYVPGDRESSDTHIRR